MAVSRRAGRSRWTLVLLVLTSITLLTLDYRGFEPLDRVRSGALSIFAPVKDAAGSVTRPIGNTWGGITNYGELEDENERLRAQVQELEESIGSTDRDRETLQRILGELTIPYAGDIPRSVAPVVFGPVSNFDHTIEIGKGSDAGFAVGMPVISSEGLVGRLVEVSPDRSVVQLITDPGFRVGVRLTDLQEVGVARGQGQDRPLIVDTGIEAELNVPDGALVTTSGLERSLFPADIPVGTVTSTEKPEGELDQDLFVEPVAALGDLAFVNVLLWEPPQ